MKKQQRRHFLCVAATTVASLHCGEAFANPENSAFPLRRSDVERGLRDGLDFREQDLKILNLLKKYSGRQVMIGGGVLTFAAEQPTEWIHLIVRLDRIEEFAKTLSLPEMPWGGAYASNGNTLSFEYEGQRYYIENLMEKEFRERLGGLTQPGSEVNGFRLEFAHDAVVYDIQAGRFGDPFGALGRRMHIELKRIAPAQGIASALRVLTEEKSIGVELPRTEKRNAEQKLEGRLKMGQKPDEQSAQVLAGISRYAEFSDEYSVRSLMRSDIVDSTLSRELGGKGREIATSFNRISRDVDEELNQGVIWHLAIQQTEKTADPEIEKTQTLAQSEMGGYEDFYSRRDLGAAAKQTASNKQIHKNREKFVAVDAMQDAVRRAPSAKAEPEETSSPAVAFSLAESQKNSEADEPETNDFIPAPELDDAPAVLPNPPSKVKIFKPSSQTKPLGKKAKLKRIANEVADDVEGVTGKIWKKLLEVEKQQRGK